jgi:hypothetical protein
MVMLSVVDLNFFMHIAETIYAECPYAECPYAECPYAECPYAECPYVECRGAILKDTPKF